MQCHFSCRISQFRITVKQHNTISIIVDMNTMMTWLQGTLSQKRSFNYRTAFRLNNYIHLKSNFYVIAHLEELECLNGVGDSGSGLSLWRKFWRSSSVSSSLANNISMVFSSLSRSYNSSAFISLTSPLCSNKIIHLINLTNTSFVFSSHFHCLLSKF